MGEEAGREPAPSHPITRRDVQFNTRLSPEHRQRLDVLLTEHPRRRVTLRDVIEDLIDEAYEQRARDDHPATQAAAVDPGPTGEEKPRPRHGSRPERRYPGTSDEDSTR